MWWASKNEFRLFVEETRMGIAGLQAEARRTRRDISEFDDHLFPDNDGDPADRLEDVETEAAIARQDATQAKIDAYGVSKTADKCVASLESHRKDICELIEKHNQMRSQLEALEKQVQCGILGHKFKFVSSGDCLCVFKCGCGASYTKSEIELNPFERKLAGLTVIAEVPKGNLGKICGKKHKEKKR